MKGNTFNLIVLLSISTSMFFSSCQKDDEAIIALDGINLSKTELWLSIGEIQPIIIQPTPAESNEQLQWTSNNIQIAEIQQNENGLVVGVKGIALGETTLTAMNSQGNITKSLPVKVIVKIESILLEEDPIADPSMTKYKVLFTPEDASIRDITWSSSHPDVAEVSQEGIVTALMEGTTTITATTEEGSKTASVEVAVSGNPPVIGLFYCSASGTGSYNADMITTSGSTQNINHTDGQPNNNYDYYEDEILNVAPASSFDLSIVQSNNWSLTVVWIDWNGDMDFIDPGEQIQVFGIPGQLNDGPFTTTVNVPGEAISGIVRMRVITGDAWTMDINAPPCGIIANSTIKDFPVEIGLTYCKVSGTGAYNMDMLTTTGGTSNINYAGEQPTNNYRHYTDEQLTVAAGSSFTLELTQSNNWSRSMVWIDWNGDKDFEDNNEQVHLFGMGSVLNDGPLSAMISVPENAYLGKVRMRIVTGDAWSYDPVPTNICGELENSTIKDFDIEIL